MTGRPPKPRRDHELAGTLAKSALARPSAALATADGVPLMPRGLDANAKKFWAFLAATRGPYLAASDAAAMQQLAELWSLRRRAYAALADDVTDKAARSAFVQYSAAFDRLAGKFGLTPADRARLGETNPADDDPAAEFIA